MTDSKKIADVSAGVVAQGGEGVSPGLPRGGKAQDEWIYGRPGIAPDFNEIVLKPRGQGISTLALEIAKCPDCRAAKSHAYSDATTPGFFYTECEKHRLIPVPADIRNAAGFTVVTEMPFEEAKRRFPEWSEARMREMDESEPGGLMACSPDILREMKEQAKIDGGVAAKLYLAGVELDREILVRWGLVENYKPKSEALNGGTETGGAAGEDRRNPVAVQENRDGDQSPAVVVGKPGVDMAGLREICAGKIPTILGTDPSISSEPLEVDLCGFKSYNDEDGEWYICGKEKHGPKVNHGEWIKV